MCSEALGTPGLVRLYESVLPACMFWHPMKPQSVTHCCYVLSTTCHSKTIPARDGTRLRRISQDRSSPGPTIALCSPFRASIKVCFGLQESWLSLLTFTPGPMRWQYSTRTHVSTT